MDEIRPNAGRKKKMNKKNTLWTRGGAGFRDQMLAVKSIKNS